MPDAQVFPNSVALLDAAGQERDWVAFERAGRAATGVPLTIAQAEHGPWQVRMLRADQAAGTSMPGVRLTGWALEADARWVFRVTDVDQGVDICAPDEAAGGETHSELRILVPYDARLEVRHGTDAAGLALAAPQVSVLDVPAGYPVIIIVRRGADDPAVPQSREAPVDANGKRMKIHRTGSATPQITLEQADGGHEVKIRWPDRSEETVLLPAPRAAAFRGLFRRRRTRA